MNGLKERNTDLFINSQMFRQGELSRRNTIWNIFKRWLRQEMQVDFLGMRTTSWRESHKWLQKKLGSTSPLMLDVRERGMCPGTSWAGGTSGDWVLTSLDRVWPSEAVPVFLRNTGYSQRCSVSNLTYCLCRRKKDGMFYIRKSLY